MIDSFLVFPGQVIGITGAFGCRGASAGVFQLHRIGSDFLQQSQDVLPAGHADSHNQDDGCRADDHAECRQQEARLAGPEAVERKLQYFAQHHRVAGAEQRLLKRVAAFFENWVHTYLED